MCRVLSIFLIESFRTFSTESIISPCSFNDLFSMERCNAVGNVLLTTHKRNKGVFVWQFFGEVLGIEAVAHVVVLNR